MKAAWTALVGFAGLLARSSSSSTAAAAAQLPAPVDHYAGLWRPQLHFSPPAGFMNDPNGLHRDANGTYHLYYQYNPDATVAGNQHWGHATSRDLYRWTNQPIALSPINATAFIFSGSAVVDADNTSGFFPDQRDGVVAIYTVSTSQPGLTLQTQFIAYSRDGGYSFTPFDRNPVLDVGSPQFRDPQVFWHRDHWVMVVAYAVEFTLGIFTSPDLKQWTHASNFTRHGLLGLQYECPNLVEVPVEGGRPGESVFLLQLSLNPGAPLGGSISQYFLGDFDGYTFTPRDHATRLSDFGKDAYAGQFFSNLPKGEALSINWASNWQYTNLVPTGPAEGWRSAMSVPRRISVREVDRLGWVEVVRPADLAPVLDAVLVDRAVANEALSLDYASVASNAVHVALHVTGLPEGAPAGTLNLTFCAPATGERLETVVFLGGDAAVAINRGKTAGFDNIYFTDKVSKSMLVGTAWSMEAILDRSVYETFLDNGWGSSTLSYYPTAPLTRLDFAAAGLPAGAAVQVKVTGLKSGWTEYSEGRAGEQP